MKNVPSTKTDWRADDDARCLTEADQIRKDPKRFSLAIEAAKHMAEKQKDLAQSMSKVSRLVKPKRIKGKK